VVVVVAVVGWLVELVLALAQVLVQDVDPRWEVAAAAPVLLLLLVVAVVCVYRRMSVSHVTVVDLPTGFVQKKAKKRCRRGRQKVSNPPSWLTLLRVHPGTHLPHPTQHPKRRVSHLPHVHLQRRRVHAAFSSVEAVGRRRPCRPTGGVWSEEGRVGRYLCGGEGGGTFFSVFNRFDHLVPLIYQHVQLVDRATQLYQHGAYDAVQLVDAVVGVLDDSPSILMDSRAF
jgi:hypothetical protein